jgi:hypothetical protein
MTDWEWIDVADAEYIDTSDMEFIDSSVTVTLTKVALSYTGKSVDPSSAFILSDVDALAFTGGDVVLAEIFELDTLTTTITEKSLSIDEAFILGDVALTFTGKLYTSDTILQLAKVALSFTGKGIDAAETYILVNFESGGLMDTGDMEFVPTGDMEWIRGGILFNFTGKDLKYDISLSLAKVALTWTGKSAFVGDIAAILDEGVGAITDGLETIIYDERGATSIVTLALLSFTYTGKDVSLAEAYITKKEALTYTGKSVSLKDVANLFVGSTAFTGKAAAVADRVVFVTLSIAFTAKGIFLNYAPQLATLPIQFVGKTIQTFIGSTVEFAKVALTFTGKALNPHDFVTLTKKALTFVGASTLYITAGTITLAIAAPLVFVGKAIYTNVVMTLAKFSFTFGGRDISAAAVVTVIRRGLNKLGLSTRLD